MPFVIIGGFPRRQHPDQTIIKPGFPSIIILCNHAASNYSAFSGRSFSQPAYCMAIQGFSQGLFVHSESCAEHFRQNNQFRFAGDTFNLFLQHIKIRRLIFPVKSGLYQGNPKIGHISKLICRRSGFIYSGTDQVLMIVGSNPLCRRNCCHLFFFTKIFFSDCSASHFLSAIRLKPEAYSVSSKDLRAFMIQNSLTPFCFSSYRIFTLPQPLIRNLPEANCLANRSSYRYSSSISREINSSTSFLRRPRE